MNKELSVCHFGSDNDIITAVDHFLEVQDADFYTEGICMLHDSWNKFVNLEGNYVVKTNELGFSKIESFHLRP